MTFLPVLSFTAVLSGRSFSVSIAPFIEETIECRKPTVYVFSTRNVFQHGKSKKTKYAKFESHRGVAVIFGLKGQMSKVYGKWVGLGSDL